MQTQLSKAALAAERGEEDRARLEAELTSALDVAGGKADKSVPSLPPQPPSERQNCGGGIGVVGRRVA
jgi:hypothetical protein